MGSFAKPHVLLVEDNPADVALFEELLEEEKCHVALCCANNGYDALDYLNRRNGFKEVKSPDIIVLDLGLPRMNGYEVLENIRNTLHLTKIPVVVLTTSRDPKDEELCKRLGASMFLSKPYDLSGYESLVHQLATVVFPSVMKSA